MSSVVSLSRVCKQYRRGQEEVNVLQNLDLEISVGNFIAVMGPSGSGKTTLLNLIGGLDVASSGRVTVAGQDLGSLPSARLASWRARHIGFVFQFYNLLPMLSAEGNVELPLLLTSLSRKQRLERTAAALELVGLSDRKRHKPGELSGGQQQRVAIARAFISDPTILICDEPTGDLDRQVAQEILELLQILNRQHGKTVIIVTHDPKAAAFAARRVLVDKGRLSRDGADMT